MAMDGALNFLTILEGKLIAEIPAPMMRLVLNIAAEALSDFEINALTTEEPGDDDLLAYYASVLSVQGRSQKTIDRYVYVINRMLSTVKMTSRRITIHHLRNFLAKEKSRGIADSTLEGYREIFSAYFNWLQRESLIDKNPTINLGAIKIPKKQKSTFSDTDMEKLHRACRSKRDRAIIAFLDSTACRISEMTELNRDEVDLQRKKLTVHGKGNKERSVILTDVAAMLLQEYLDSRTDDNPALFIGLKSERLEPGGVRRMLQQVGKRAGVEHVHPHKFRRTKATKMAKNGAQLQIIQKYLGHEKTDTTLEYVMLDDTDVEAQVRRCS